MSIVHLDCRERQLSQVDDLESGIQRACLKAVADVLFLQRYWSSYYIDVPERGRFDLSGVCLLANSSGDGELEKALSGYLSSAGVRVHRLVTDIKKGIYRASISSRDWDPRPHFETVARSLGSNRTVSVSTEYSSHGPRGLGKHTQFESSLGVEGDPVVVASIQSLMGELLKQFDGRRGTKAGHAMSFLR